MITKEEIDWLYRVLFDREVEDVSIYAWVDKTFENFSIARAALMGSEEFSMKYRLARASYSSESHAHEESFNTYSMPTIENYTITVQEFSDRTEALLLQSHLSRTSIKSIVTIGTPRAHDLGRQIAFRSATKPILYQISSKHSKSPRVIYYNDGAIKCLEIQTTASPFMSRLTSDGLAIDMIITDDPSLKKVDFVDMYERLSDQGVIYDLSHQDLVSQVAADRLLDVIKVGCRSMLPRRTWPLEVKFQRGLASKPRNARKIAVATIVKDEEAFIEGMIRSCAPICSHMIIVDTGSSDRTIEIARRALDNVNLSSEIFIEEFIDFSSSRNSALSKVPSHFEWIMMLDADERIVPEDYDKFGDLLEQEFDAYMLPRYNFSDVQMKQEPFAYPDRQGRLIRNRVASPIRYRGAVHEVLDNVRSWGLPPANLDGLGRGFGGPHIYHFGYADIAPEVLEKKKALYKRLQGS